MIIRSVFLIWFLNRRCDGPGPYERIECVDNKS
jgi:hypothetical protein